jgi:hypothetical protein
MLLNLINLVYKPQVKGEENSESIEDATESK